jgi:hypothetical protein
LKILPNSRAYEATDLLPLPFCAFRQMQFKCGSLSLRRSTQKRVRCFKINSLK